MERLRKQLAKFIYSYLRACARLQLKKYNSIIIGITGTAGKSTIVLATQTILETRYKVLSSYQKGRGLNSRTGIPFVILGIMPEGYSFLNWLKYILLCPVKLITNWEKYNYLVLEYGIDTKDEMEDLLKIAIPEIGIWINTGSTHIGNFEGKFASPKKAIDAIAFEESKMIKALKHNGTAIIRIDDTHMRKQLKLWKSKKTTKIYISSETVKSTLSNGELFYEFSYENKTYKSVIKKYALTQDHPFSFISAILVGYKCNISIKDGIKILENELELPKGRNSLIAGRNNSLIIDSSYNSSPDALNSAIETLASFNSRPKIAVLGDMRELGDVSLKLHKDAADYMAKILPKDSLIVTIGPMMKEYLTPELISFGFINVKNFMIAGDAGRYLLTMVEQLKYSSSILLVKGSQNTIFTEIIVEMLMANPKEKNELLTRRGQYWDKLRQPFL